MKFINPAMTAILEIREVQTLASRKLSETLTDRSLETGKAS